MGCFQMKIVMEVSPLVYEKIAYLLATGLYGKDVAEVSERLVCRALEKINPRLQSKAAAPPG